MENIFSIIIPVALFSLGIWLFIPGLKGVLYGPTSRNWPKTKGVVLSSEIEYGNNINHVRSSAAIVKYRYWIEGESYVSSTIGYGKAGTKFNAKSKQEYAEDIVSQYLKGDAVDVYYNPKNCNITVLEPGFSWVSVGILLFGTMFMGFAASGIFK